MPKCTICDNVFPFFVEINGKRRNLQRRKYCLVCSPFGQHNTKTLEKTQTSWSAKRCKFCNKPLSGRQKTFCQHDCQAEYHYREYIARWKQGLETGLREKYDISTRIKKYLFEKFDHKCSNCGWSKINPFTGKIPLEVHHKDGDYTNNNEENLDLLCPNCHSLTSTYKNGNANNGRKERQKLT